MERFFVYAAKDAAGEDKHDAMCGFKLTSLIKHIERQIRRMITASYHPVYG